MTCLGFILISSLSISSFVTALPEPRPVEIEEEDLCPDCHCGHCDEEQTCLCDDKEVCCSFTTKYFGYVPESSL